MTAVEEAAAAAADLGSADAARVCVALDTLGLTAQAADGDLPSEIAKMLLARGDVPMTDDVVRVWARALGNTGVTAVIPALVELASHPDPSVRLEVAQGLPRCVDEDDDALTRAASTALIGLSRDDDPKVRDWATFGVGVQLTADGHDIREALVARLDETAADIADEALNGLARRHDPRAVDIVRERLQRDVVGRLVFDSAVFLADPSLLEPLRAWQPIDEDVTAAIEACDPVHQAARRDRHRNLVVAIEVADPTLVPTLAMDRAGATDVELHVGEFIWDADRLIERAHDDPATAARLVIEDLTS